VDICGVSIRSQTISHSGNLSVGVHLPRGNVNLSLELLVNAHEDVFVAKTGTLQVNHIGGILGQPSALRSRDARFSSQAALKTLLQN
jgi:hypothetical protein